MINRSKAAVLNSSIALFAQALMIAVQFISRTIFIHVLGDQYLGLNGLFVNILSILNLAELGIGSAITFSLYRPLVNEDHNEIAAIMALLKKWYKVIAIIVVSSGLVLMPFVPRMIHKSTFSNISIMIYFFIALMGTVSTYLLSYKRTLLIADQRGYVNTLNTVGFSVIMQVVQIIELLFYHSFLWYLVLQVLFNLGSNFFIAYRVDKQYPYLKNPPQSVSNDVMFYFKRNVKGMLSAKMGGIIVNSTDNLILSSFLGLGVVGQYANYVLITNGLTSILTQSVTAVSSSIGNLAVSSNFKKQKEIIEKYFALTSVFSVLMSVGFVTFSPSFIRIWLGPKYLLNNFTVFIIGTNFLIQSIRQALIGISNSYGLYWQQRYKPIFEASINLVISILLVKFTDLSISGVLLGTISSNLLVNFWWEPFVVFKYGLHSPMRKFLIEYGIIIFISCVFLYVGVVISSYTTTIVNGILTTIGYMIFCSIFCAFYLYKKRIFFKDVLKKFRL